jgi:SRSO17 transposase
VKGAGSEIEKTRVIRGRNFASCDLATARRLVGEYFREGRGRIATELAQHWQWRSRSGRLKVRAALAILVTLERGGHLQLPPPLIVHGPVRDTGDWACATPPGTDLTDGLGQCLPLHWQLADSTEQRRQWRGVLARHHYLGAPGLVGAQLRYLVYGASGELMAALGWQSAVERLDCRDQLVGVSGRADWRARFLIHAVNNVRFLVLPWVRVRHLASAVLGQGLERLRRDWPRRYGAPVWLAESFVDRRRFGGASYRAANWVAIGWTRGYAKQQGQFHYHGQPKEVYVYVIEKRIRQLLSEDPAQALLTREFLLARRPPGNPQPQARRTIMSEALQSWAPKVPPQWNLSPEDLEHVGQELHEFIGEFDDTFGRIEPAGLCRLYVRGLLSGTARKNVEAMALELESPKVVRNLQRFISEYEWDEGRMRDRHWQLSAQSLADEQGVWSIDASEFAKKGKESVGVAPQYCGALGKTANCQSGVFVCYSGPKGHALLDARLYLPQCWFSEAYRERREQKCRVPKEVVFQTKPQIALELCNELWKTKLFPGQWVTCDASFGNNEAFLAQLPEGMLYLAEISCTRKVWLKHAPQHPAWETAGGTVEQLVDEEDLLHWQSRKIAEGEKGPIVASFARVRVYLSPQRTPESERTLLLRNDPDGRIKYALSNAPESVAMSELVRVSAARWPIERCFQEDKSELGLDHYEHRSWAAWHRHMRLVFLAHLFLTRLRLKYKKSPGPDVAASSSLAGMELASPDARPRLRPGLRPLPSIAQPLRLPIPSQTPA